MTTNRFDIFGLMRDVMSQEKSVEKAFDELMMAVSELKAENKINARSYQDARKEAAEYREQWLKAEERTNALIVKLHSNCSPSSPGWPVPLRDTDIEKITDACFQSVGYQGTRVLMREVARSVERQHGIGLQTVCKT